jgi:hypothetical protein
LQVKNFDEKAAAWLDSLPTARDKDRLARTAAVLYWIMRRARTNIHWAVIKDLWEDMPMTKTMCVPEPVKGFRHGRVSVHVLDGPCVVLWIGDGHLRLETYVPGDPGAPHHLTSWPLEA